VSTGTPSNFSQPRLALVNVHTTNYPGIIDGSGNGDLSRCQVTNCLSSSSGSFFGARDMQFGLKFLF
jgi:hypothetical protein